MALINNIRIHVVDEEVSRDVRSTSYAVETGIELTDTVKKSPITLTISGFIVDVGSTKADDILQKLIKLKTSGSVITYSGRNRLKNMQIIRINTTHSKEVWGGMAFNMELKEFRVAKPAYKAPTTSNAASTSTTKVQPKLEVGAIVVFTGGSVYVSSDAKKAAATRGRSTCKITIINERSWAVHPYHLISTDGGKVYGWVDKANIEGVPSSTTTAKSNGGTQQVTNGTGTAVYHTVKKGDTIWTLVNKNYKSLGKSVQWVIDNNSHAFSRKGDATTLQVGKKLLMGYKG